MELVGTILQLQVQVAPLKVGTSPDRRYDPSALRAMPTLILTAEGITGLLPDGETIMDVHHVRHPLSRNNGGNGISFNFTTNYHLMQQQFGDHLVNGCAGENILIATTENPLAAVTGHRFAIQTQDHQIVYLTEVMVAAPCVAFSHYALHKTGTPVEAVEIKTALQFLDNGRRGFYATTEQDSVVIRTGDSVYRVD